MTVSQAVDTHNLILESLPPEMRSDPAINSLVSILERYLNPADLAERLDAFVALKRWVSTGKGVSGATRPRLGNFLTLIESQTELRKAFQAASRQVLTELRSVELFAEAGLQPHAGLWSETIRRITQRILPSAQSETDLRWLVVRLYPTAKDIDRLFELPDEQFERMARALSPAEDAAAWAVQRSDLTQAFQLLAVHIAGLGLSPEMRARSTPNAIEESPYYRIQQATAELVKQSGTPDTIREWRTQAHRIREELEHAHLRMEDAGVSTALVFDLLTIERALNRMQCIAVLLFVAEPHEAIVAVKVLLDDVMNSRRDELSVRGLLRENTALLARKIVERTGKTGEHYIANTRKEYRSIWKASLGGGLLTVLTAAIKMRVVEAHFPPFVEFMAAGMDYALSFIVMQHLHLALATKQPSVTAATFAGIVRTSQGKERLERVAEFVSRIARSQLASAIANLIAVGGGCVAFAELWFYIFGSRYLDVQTSKYVYFTLDPFGSGTIIFAAITGLILWVSALAGGWIENFFKFNSIPLAIAQHPAGHTFGQQRMKRLANFIDANISGWGTCIVLGFGLGFVPALGKFLGVPLDVRHVTLTTGTLALAAASFGKDWLYRGWFIYTVYGVAVTFVVNLGVSFSIAASVALRAYGVPGKEQWRLLRHTIKSFFRSPARFLFPPRINVETSEADRAGHQAS
ncbi:site-specific recombinase [Occallatibacter riparius]|uniref:Site-specific recombinase n=1 Tax=Occallatibacter riparius TaxID=1002689 RepID=A0A9J7BFI5_9BACT|nr:site-specific recombinase [Occallatibacter riparius]UWZ81772.1 site-specific recombinase [Occallatibacter riparius]